MWVLEIESWSFSEDLEFNVSSKYNAVMINERQVKAAATRHGRKYGYSAQKG
jgi:hypothetical protein